MAFPNYSALFTLGLCAASPRLPLSPMGENEVARVENHKSFLSLDLPDVASLRPSSTRRRAARSHLSLASTSKPSVDVAYRSSWASKPSKPAPSSPLPYTPSDDPILSLPSALGLYDATNLPRSDARPQSFASFSTVASPRRRHIQRSDALAFLEGRAPRAALRRQPSKRNFMSMSDDEDDGDDERERDPEDAVAHLNPINEEEDLVLPRELWFAPTAPSNPRPLASPKRHSRTRARSTSHAQAASPTSRTASPWVLPRNFIDLAADDESTLSSSPRSPSSFFSFGNFRSFVDIDLASALAH